jgi:hypothetical protein
MNKYLIAAAFGLSVVSVTPANAHGYSAPSHGGIVQAASGLSFELVALPDGAAIYVVEDDEPMSPSGLKGKLTVVNGTDKTETELAVAGDKLVAKGAKLPSGAKVVATLVTPGAKLITVRFTAQ